jgi:hypothetical protein
MSCDTSKSGSQPRAAGGARRQPRALPGAIGPTHADSDQSSWWASPLAAHEIAFVATTEPSKPDDDRLRRLVVARGAAQNALQ